MERRPEPELMNDPIQAQAYANADFSRPHNLFVELFRDRFGPAPGGIVLDLGCGAGDICVRFAEAFPESRLVGVDGSGAMLALADQRVREQGLQHRIRLLEEYLPGAVLSGHRYDIVMSNSLLHHLTDPQTLWQTVTDAVVPGGPVCVMDLMRPDSESMAARLVRNVAGDEPEILQRDFHHSLLAAYRPEEIELQLEVAGINTLNVEVIDDHHLLISGRLT